MSDSLWPRGLQHTRLPCPSLSPRVCSNSCPSSQWYYLTISSFAALFFCFQSSPASESFPMSQFFTLGGQSIGASALASVLAVNVQGWFPLGWTGLISLKKKKEIFGEILKTIFKKINKDNLLIKEEQFAKLFFSITTLLFTLLATAMFG